MHIDVVRFSLGIDSTLSLVYIDHASHNIAYGIEDVFREMKIPGVTRIPAGTYELGLRTVGGKHAKYKKKFPSFHIGMIEVQDVPNYKYILHHIGNDADDTEGCLCVGSSANLNYINEGFISGSTSAYERYYLAVAPIIASGEVVTCTYHDGMFNQVPSGIHYERITSAS